jgi:hypothetical protein
VLPGSKKISPCPRRPLSQEGIPPGKILDFGVGHLLAVKNCEDGERDILGAKIKYNLSTVLVVSFEPS